MSEILENSSSSKASKLSRKTRKITFVCLFFLLFGSFGMDQLTKVLAEKNFMVWENKDNISQYEGKRYPLGLIGWKDSLEPEKSFYVAFAFNYVRNQGAAWGLFSTLDEAIRKPFFHLITILATIFIFLYWRATPTYCRLIRFSLALIFSGAIGNFTDRFLRGFVVDFLDVSWSFPLPFKLDFSIDIFPKFLDFLNITLNAGHWAYDFPKFNWADSCITVGVSFLLIDMLFFEVKRNKKLALLKAKEEVG